ncbi:hypothetical protein [Terrihabitans rhizophilus]|uniref:DUF4175 domain-containing protein n=1 Tax=Terrihabitans rhizophilus TaxID=3092662 RepID=A0ABU4RQQ9_9HYPH|nr:hypothetical protein [Terrihabitans sp. PJ23]MDX6807152.1 hypothetical protein [Terrihabitans sp. PJ23]
MVWPFAWAILVIGWIGYLYFYPFDWLSFCVGAASAGIPLLQMLDRALERAKG